MRQEIMEKRRQRARTAFLQEERRRQLKDERELAAAAWQQDAEMLQMYREEGWFERFERERARRRGDPHAEDDEATSPVF